MKNLSPHSFGRVLRPAFSLIEIIVVVMIIAILMALMTPPLLSVMEGNRLTQSGQGLLFRVSMAQQMALTDNRPVELRFFHYADDNGFEGYHATQIYFYDEASNDQEPIESPLYFSQGIMIPDSPVSPLLSGLTEDAPAAEKEPFKSMGAKYQRIIFYPNGSTSINAPLRDAYLTLCAVRTDTSDASVPPINYYTIQIDPVNGSTKSYRPN
ncbi:uncharacterized protein (TIGR02596 family) [Prosthecobacter fusiformis]|uniref:Uncharacterized protein (TIGR02596 family) n=1 Tax=Prosthecobacter fusiformis TaxID=48464 RepID=A0A4R7SNL0_9BACT|nr:Verru_Chthon cassette protein D [Prosthecobacter fusiformis]TDU80760.1 uncharacterized protein (TIGR02596 family) [Prosthecobacter fusiformis]